MTDEDPKILGLDERAAKPKRALKENPAPEPTDDQHRRRLRRGASQRSALRRHWGHWYEWNGKLWREDDTLRAFDLIRKTCKAQGIERAGMAKMVEAVHTLVRPDRRIAATVDQWDADPWLLNTPDGIVDLRDGTRAQERPARLLHQDHGGRAAWRLSAVSRVPRPDHGRRRGADRLPSAGLRLLPDRRHQRAGDLLQLRRRPERQDGADVDRIGHPRRLLHGRRPSRRSPRARATGTRPSWRGCAALVWSPPPRRRPDGTGRKAASRN